MTDQPKPPQSRQFGAMAIANYVGELMAWMDRSEAQEVQIAALIDSEKKKDVRIAELEAELAQKATA